MDLVCISDFKCGFESGQVFYNCSDDCWLVLAKLLLKMQLINKNIKIISIKILSLPIILVAEEVKESEKKPTEITNAHKPSNSTQPANGKLPEGMELY